MGQSYTVQQGDHISGIAETFGFADYNNIWNDPANADLAGKRDNPHVLFPGDVLFIPDKQQKWEDAATTLVHIFQLGAPPLKIRLVLKDFDGEPLANVDCTLEVAGVESQLTTDSTGLIEATVPPSAKEGTLKVPDLDLEIPVSIGELDPVDQKSGWMMRLINLGYLDGEVDESDQALVRSAIEEFQCDQKLPVTGDADDATVQKLKDVHGS